MAAAPGRKTASFFQSHDQVLMKWRNWKRAAHKPPAYLALHLGLAPCAQNRAEEHEVEEMVAGFNRPDFKAMTCKQFVDQVCGGDIRFYKADEDESALLG